MNLVRQIRVFISGAFAGNHRALESMLKSRVLASHKYVPRN